jgi:outer membrane protein
MNRTLAFVAAMGAGLMIATGVAQTVGPQAPVASAPSAPYAGPSKIAVIEYEQVAAATNEGQRALQELQKKYEPKKTALEQLAQEVDTLKKQLQAAPSTMSDEDRASRGRDIDTKEKQLQRDSDDATAAYNADVQDALAKIAKKLGPTVMKYVQANGYTILLNNTGQQGGLDVMWTVNGTDISQPVVDAYNAESKVPALPPSAPTANRPHAATGAKR